MLKMKLKKFALIACIIALVVFPCDIVGIQSTTIKQNVSAASKSDIQTAELELNDSLTTKDIIKLSEGFNDLIDSFVNESIVGSRKYIGFYRIPKGIALEDVGLRKSLL